MDLPKKFYEDEVRDGFYVPAQVKQSWAISLEVISEIDKVCKKHGIKYFADYGTFLGAVRHAGPIPWDDDFDICMLRTDYEKFLEVAPGELPADYAIENIRTHEENWDFNFFLSRVINKNRICFEKEHLEKYHGFPYMTGTDIFVLDNISDDPAEEEARIKRAMEDLAKAEIAKKKAGKEAEREWLLETEKEFKTFSDRKTKYVSEMIQWGLKKNRYVKSEVYDETYYLDFENTKMPVPGDYESLLMMKYWNYIEPAPDVAGHDYPFFEGQQKQLEQTMGFSVPSFSLAEEFLERQHPSEGGRREDSKQYSEYLCRLTQEVVDSSSSLMWDDCREILTDCQQFAIDFGTWIESIKGENTESVGLLEEYCERIATAYECIIKGQPFDFSLLNKMAVKISDAVKREVHDRREVVFMPFSGEYWGAFEQAYRDEFEKEDTDVYVVPVPYFYKNYDGTLKDMQYDMTSYPKDLHVISIDRFDFELHKPDAIYIQNPYDEWNAETSIHPDYYSRKLQKYTERLVYVPWFTTSEFTKRDERSYHNMKYYCTMPGVIYSDEVYVQSESIRALYIDKLCEFAGEGTRGVWEEKIFATPMNQEENIPHKKKILFSVCPATAAEKDEDFLEKLDEVLNIFKENRDKISLLWNNPPVDCDVSDIHSKLLKRLDERYAKYCREGWGFHSESTDFRTVSAECDAYYGTSGKLAYQCHVLNKPVMVTNDL